MFKLEKYSEFHHAELPEVPCIATQFPFKNAVSSVLLQLKVYPKIQSYFQNAVNSGENYLTMEILSFDKKFRNQMQIYAPYGNQSRMYLLTTYVQPKTKEQSEKYEKYQ